MVEVKFIIVGAGPSGLTFASKLMEFGEENFLVLEKENEAGGLCRSADVDGAPLDIGGGHFLDSKRQAVLDLVHKFMPPEEWDTYDRISKIFIHNKEIGSPIESFIWQMPENVQERYLDDIKNAGCNLGEPKPEKFVDWIYWKLGRSIAEDYMLPYNRKMFGENLNNLGTYWLEKLPDVSYEQTLKSCEKKRFYGVQPAHSRFFYPKKFGYGEVWNRMGKALGSRLVLGEKADNLDLAKRVVNEKYTADIIVNTAPWPSFSKITGISEKAKNIVKSLKYSSVDIDYIPESIDTDAQWIYYPDPELSYHRILVRHNFCPNSKGYWTETNSNRAEDLSPGTARFRNKYAYPHNTINKNEMMAELLKEMESNGVIGLGRWGEWQHFNSDVVTERAILLAESLINSGNT
ncbi:MAG: NAD(P)-binding protein [Lentisphaerae bacterium]|jgi:protoporphyrinogen oxidase|nr:NAD(P)-binding protein [Lentisphaerota bacterium]